MHFARYSLRMARFWLLKCEPDVYSIDDLARDGRTGWDGVRNYQVRNFMRDDMKVGDLGIFYHSNAEPPGAAGVVRIERTGVPDLTQFDPKSDYHDPKSQREAPTWLMCEVSFVERFKEFVALETLRSDAALASLLIFRRGNRLSITPLEQAEFERIRVLGAGGGGAGRAGTVQKGVGQKGAAAKPNSRGKGSIRAAK
ncbi:MAG: hypothetical protein RL591_1974 [Planctomycetota bacterium]